MRSWGMVVHKNGPFGPGIRITHNTVHSRCALMVVNFTSLFCRNRGCVVLIVVAIRLSVMHGSNCPIKSVRIKYRIYFGHIYHTTPTKRP